MSQPKSLGTVETPYGAARIIVGRYPKGGAISVQLLLGDDPDDGWILSTNLGPYGARVAHDEFTVKSWSENEPLIEPLLASGLFEDTGRRCASGFVQAPVKRVKDADNVPASAVRAS